MQVLCCEIREVLCYSALLALWSDWKSECPYSRFVSFSVWVYNRGVETTLDASYDTPGYSNNIPIPLISNISSPLTHESWVTYQCGMLLADRNELMFLFNWSLLLSLGQTLHPRRVRQCYQETAGGAAPPHRYLHQTKISGKHHVSKALMKQKKKNGFVGVYVVLMLVCLTS